MIATLLALASCVLPAQVQTKPTTRELIAVLEQPGATLHDKARACQQLGEFGTGEAVPALAALLSDPHLGAYARSGLEGIPDPSAAAALRAALGTVQRNQLIGVVNSLGVLRDAHAAAALTRLAADPASPAAKAALLALGRISNRESIAFLRKALSTGPASLRGEAAAACVLAAEFQLSQNAAPAAAELYDAVRAADVPAPFRVAATRGAILARKSGGIDLLVKLLRSDDRETRNIALFAVRDMREPKVGGALAAEIKTAKPEVHAQLLVALADCCRDPQSLRLIRAGATSASSDVRVAAFKALGMIADRSDASILVDAVAGSRSAAETETASESLARIEGPDVDGLVLKRVRAASNPAARAALIDVLDARPPSRAIVPDLLKQAAGPDVKVSVAALRALRSPAAVEDLPALIALTRTYKDGSQRAAAESTLYYASTRTRDTGKAGELLLAELDRASEDLDRHSWIKTLSLIGYEKALPAVTASLRSTNSWLVNVTIESLGDWPGSAPIEELLGLAETAAVPETRTRAFRAALQLAAGAAEKRLAPDANLLAWFRRLGEAARPAAEKKMVVAALDRWSNIYRRTPDEAHRALIDNIEKLRRSIAAASGPGPRR